MKHPADLRYTYKYKGAHGTFEDGKEPKISIRFKQNMFNEIRKLAAENNRSFAFTVRRLCYLGLAHVKQVKEKADDRLIKD